MGALTGGEVIAACITAWGHAAVAVVRASGREVRAAVEPVTGPLPPPRHARHVRLRDDDGVFDDGLVTYFPGPRSYTGEDVVEISCHGNPLIVERLLRALRARPAHPGEFTRRAFLNGRLDLTRAEAVMATIAATSRRGLDLARAGLDGAVAREVESLRDALVDVAAELEAILDYPGEDLLFDDDAGLRARMLAVADRAGGLAASQRAGRVAVEGARVVLAGPVNAGKSSLFNALLGRERAIVSPEPGTTRDVVEATLQLEGARLVLVDTAGERDSSGEIEARGIAMGRAEQQAADLVIRCVPPGAHAAAGDELLVYTFGDLAPREGLSVSSRTGEGLDALRAAILSRLGVDDLGAGAVIHSARQAECLARVATHAREAAIALSDAGPAAAVERLYAAVEALDDTVGGAREDVLDRLFSRFCVGK
ncbi:MAG: tRNA modification GTPase [Deltaproteobacteria bacterium]|nr:tRNA modification GTPase [Deltaproteobacteria bacterium]